LRQFEPALSSAFSELLDAAQDPLGAAYHALWIISEGRLRRSVFACGNEALRDSPAVVPADDLIEAGNPGTDVVSPVWRRFALDPAPPVFCAVVPAI